MPAICRCRVTGCTFEGNHGFTSDIGNIIHFYHGNHNDGYHSWYQTTLPNGDKFETPDRMSAFEKGVVPRVTAENRPGTEFWIKGMRARIIGNEPLANRYLNQWLQANNV
jgi:hypothetical protein